MGIPCEHWTLLAVVGTWFALHTRLICVHLPFLTICVYGNCPSLVDFLTSWLFIFHFQFMWSAFFWPLGWGFNLGGISTNPQNFEITLSKTLEWEKICSRGQYWRIHLVWRGMCRAYFERSVIIYLQTFVCRRACTLSLVNNFVCGWFLIRPYCSTFRH